MLINYNLFKNFVIVCSQFMKDCTVLINFYGGRKEVLKYLKSSKMENEGNDLQNIIIICTL